MKLPSYSPLFAVFIGAISWVVPGLGQIVLGHRARGIVILVGICGLFMLGLWIGSIGVIDPVQAVLWYGGQMLASPVVAFIADYTRPVNGIWPYSSNGRPYEIGQIYTAIAGALNLLCIVNAMYIAYTGKQQPDGGENA